MPLDDPRTPASATPGPPHEDALAAFAEPVRAWFQAALGEPTPPQARAWAPIGRGESTLLLSPTGSGKTLAAFLWCLQRLMFEAPGPAAESGCRVIYVSPIKALAVDVERNLRAPLAGIANAAARTGVEVRIPTIAVRTGDTPAQDRAKFLRKPADILITTPESLFLLLTSRAREVLRSADTVILDEIHAMVPTKRGAHLALSLERLERERLRAEPVSPRGLQRIGLSATQRPLDEIARFLGGFAPGPKGRMAPRDVTIVDAGIKKALDLKVEVPLEDMADVNKVIEIPSGPAAQGTKRYSIWDAIHPRLVELVREHRSTIMFTNSRRLAERIAGAINELAEEDLVRAHHGSLSRERRATVEDALKTGHLRGIVATSSLELGIDMGSVDLVIQIEAPPSVASGLQRVGRASHQVGATSKGIVFPKYRADLVACAALVKAMHAGEVEATRYPKNPVDVLAQQVVAAVAMEDWSVAELHDFVRGAAPFAELTRGSLEGVLDMLSGRYASDAFAELRPRLTWDRVADVLQTRRGAQRVAVTNPGTIPDRGLYPVYLVGDDAAPGQSPRGRSRRVGELDEEMVFESVKGDTFILGASTWRVEEITHDRVTVSPAPGQPGRMPFWRGERVGRPLEFGQQIGAMVRGLVDADPERARAILVAEHGLDDQAAKNLLDYLADQRGAGAPIPDDRTVIVERSRDDLGDWRICVLSPLGGQVLAPWAMAVARKLQDAHDIDVELSWTDDGFVIRMPETDAPPPTTLFVPDPDEVEDLVVEQLGATAMFAARFREAAGRALLLPRRSPNHRAPLWQQRKRAADLLKVAAQYPSFPMILESYRECLADVFDMPALVTVLRGIRERSIEVREADLDKPSPFAAAILFGFVAEYLYDGDAPLAERRAQALTIDHERLRELMGELELRELLDLDVMAEVEAQLQSLDRGRPLASADGVHDLLLRLGDLSPAELARRASSRDSPASPQLEAWVDDLVARRRLVELEVGGERRLVPIEYVARYRDALGVMPPPGLPQQLLDTPRDPLGDLVRRHARTHGPFNAAEVARRYDTAVSTITPVLERLTSQGELTAGAFRKGFSDEEWCDPDILARVRQRSLARIRRQVEPVEPEVLGRALLTWQGLSRPHRGPDAILDAIEKLQGVALPASVLEREVLAARVREYSPADLDLLISAGEIVWQGVAPLGQSDGRIALYLADDAPLLQPLWAPAGDDLSSVETQIVATLERRGASFFDAIQSDRGGFANDTVEALWKLVWRGLITNDTLAPVRAFVRPKTSGGRSSRGRGRGGGLGFRSRRSAPPTTEGRWALVSSVGIHVDRRGSRRAGTAAANAERLGRIAQQLLDRYGLVTREVAAAEGIEGGFGTIYDVFRAMEDAGRIRRGYFVTGISTLQFAQPAMLDLLRSQRQRGDEPQAVLLSATDPACPYGTLLPWPRPAVDDANRKLTRSTGAVVVCVDGELVAYVSKSGRRVRMAHIGDEHWRELAWKLAASELATRARRLGSRRSTHLMFNEIDGQAAHAHPFAAALLSAGFRPIGDGLKGPTGEYDG